MLVMTLRPTSSARRSRSPARLRSCASRAGQSGWRHNTPTSSETCPVCVVWALALLGYWGPFSHLHRQGSARRPHRVCRPHPIPTVRYRNAINPRSSTPPMRNKMANVRRPIISIPCVDGAVSAGTSQNVRQSGRSRQPFTLTGITKVLVIICKLHEWLYLSIRLEVTANSVSSTVVPLTGRPQNPAILGLK
jgi:hypothetical protein